jgi:predicted anti-sigma-YlaC factor YlaD
MAPFRDTGLTCRELVELVTAYLENALPLAERKRVEEHLTWCEGCRNYLEQMRQTIRVTGTLTEETLPAGARADLLQAFRDWNVRA